MWIVWIVSVVCTVPVGVLGVGAQGVWFPVDDDVGPGGPHAATLHTLEHQGVAADAERGDGAGNHQRRHGHVTGDARLSVEPGDAPARTGHGSIRAMAQPAPKPLSMPTTLTPLAHDACIASSAVTPSSPAP